jgi:hypothetical protein
VTAVHRRVLAAQKGLSAPARALFSGWTPGSQTGSLAAPQP